MRYSTTGTSPDGAPWERSIRQVAAVCKPHPRPRTRMARGAQGFNRPDGLSAQRLPRAGESAMTPGQTKGVEDDEGQAASRATYLGGARLRCRDDGHGGKLLSRRVPRRHEARRHRRQGLVPKGRAELQRALSGCVQEVRVHVRLWSFAKADSRPAAPARASSCPAAPAARSALAARALPRHRLAARGDRL